MLLAILPDEARVDLGDSYKGVSAVYRPMDVADKAAWYDECGGNTGTAAARVLAVHRQLLRIEGMKAQETVKEGDTEKLVTVPFDAKNPKHFAALPSDIIVDVFVELFARTYIKGADEKN